VSRRHEADKGEYLEMGNVALAATLFAEFTDDNQLRALM
jgi:hypothetical protein